MISKAKETISVIRQR